MLKRPFRRRRSAPDPRALAVSRSRARTRLLGGLVTLVALIAFTVWAIPRLDRIASQEKAGSAQVADGDTLTLDNERIRLKGIDAPELHQSCRAAGSDYACGRSARRELLRLIGDKPVTCEGWERDRYGRLLALCSAGGTELNAMLVTNGWAVSYGAYGAEESAAKAARRGLWAGEFVRPSDWRAAHGDMAGAEHTSWQAVLNALKALLGIS
jgi:endonuclease YncB( thermonuclease family)